MSGYMSECMSGCMSGWESEWVKGWESEYIKHLGNYNKFIPSNQRADRKQRIFVL